MSRRICVSGIIFLIFVSCSQTDSIFLLSSRGVYKVSARAGQYTLDECGVIQAATPIYPFFIDSVDDDPDIQQLTIFLQTPYGDILSKKVTYIIDADRATSTTDFASPNSAEETYKPPGTGPADIPVFTPDPDAGSGVDSGFTSSDAGSASNPVVTPDAGFEADAGFIPNAGFEDDLGFTPNAGSEDDSDLTPDAASEDDLGFTHDAGSASDPIVTPDSATASGFDSPADFDSGVSIGFIPDSLSEAAYAATYPWEGTAEETGKNEEVYRFLKRGSVVQPNASYNEDIIYVNKLSGSLPSLLLPEDMEAGQYLLVFQIIGKKGVLNQIEKPFYYIGTSEFTLDDIHAYLPGIFDKGHLVSPEIPIMLETRLAAGSDLTPYVVWYNGKKRIREGFIADGAARFIWQTPSQTGFHQLRVEAFPFKPLNSGVETPIGKSKELSLPVASKNEGLSILARAGISFSGQDLIPVRRYQLFADLEDSQSSRGGRSALVPVDHTPEWQPWGNIFGLAVGPEHSFSIPSPLFAPMEEFEGQLVFRFAPLAEGIIFSGSFKQEVRHEQKNVFERSEWFETVDVNLSYAEGMVILRYFAGDAWGEKNIFLLPGQTESIITVVLSFEVQENTLRFSLGLNAPVKFLPDEGILLSGPLTGEGTFRLGAAFGGTSMPVVPSVQSSAAEIFSSDWDIETSLIFGTETKPLSPAYILDEFIVSVVPNTSLNKRSEAVDVVSTSSSAEIPEDVSSGILPEDIPIEAAIDGNEEYRIEEISDEYEITGLPAISDGTTAIFY